MAKKILDRFVNRMMYVIKLNQSKKRNLSLTGLTILKTNKSIDLLSLMSKTSTLVFLEIRC